MVKCYSPKQNKEEKEGGKKVKKENEHYRSRCKVEPVANTLRHYLN